MASLAKNILNTGTVFSLALTLALVNVPLTQAQQSGNTNELRPLNQSNTLLSLQGGQKLMEEAKRAIESQEYRSAVVKLKQARQVYQQLSNFYLQLANSFAGIDPIIYERHRNNALKTGNMRDEATYQLALIHRAQQQPELSVPLLIQVIRSQNPTSELGKKSYQQLYELGFVDSPFQTSSN